MLPTVKRRIVGQEEQHAIDALPNHLPIVVRQVLANRGIRQSQSLDLNINRLLPYRTLKDIDDGAAILEHALRQHQRILVVGDYDADGATATALTCLVLRAFGHSKVEYVVPDRFTLGYGLSAALADIAIAQSPDLVITVDNGISSVEGIGKLRQAGIQVVITDHHLPGERLPEANATINPNQQGCEFPSKAACGCAVAFYLMAALRARLIESAWFGDKPVPVLADYLDLVALATVADVVPLDHNNRILVHQGISRIRAGRCRPGITALLRIAGKQPDQVTGMDLGFAIGPRLNAAGRMEDMSLGIACLMSDADVEAATLATRLDHLNQERKGVEQVMQDQALLWLASFQASDNLPWGLCLFDADWHEGVIGILASRIKERTHRPVIAFAPSGGTEIKGSARSIPGFHLRDALDRIATRHPTLLNRFGGHAMAAGLTLDAAQLPAFKAVFDQVVREQLTDDDLQAVLWSDGDLSASDVSLELAFQLRDAGPWGHQFPPPAFDGVFDVIDQRIVGSNHLKMVVSPPNSDTRVDAIVFNVDLNLWPTQSAQISMRYQLDINVFRGATKLQLLGDCLMPLTVA